MDETTTRLEEAEQLLRELAHLDFRALGDEGVCEATGRVEQLGRCVDTLRVRAAAEIDERSRFDLGTAGLSYRLGERRGVDLVERITRVSAAEAGRRVKLGAAITFRTTLDGRPLPSRHEAVAEAMTAGAIGVDAAQVIVRCLDQAAERCTDVDLLATAEARLVEGAAVESADLVGVQARVWREALDPDGAQPRDEHARAKRGLLLGRDSNGSAPFSGNCTPTFAALLRAVFSEANAPDATPRFLSAEDIAAGTETITTDTGDTITTVRDPQTRAQRQFDVLEGLITAGIRSPGVSIRSTASVTAVIRLEDLQNGTGVGWLDDVIEPVSALTVQELACEGGIRKVLLGNSGEVLYEGLRERFFTPAQRRALAVRDGGCVWGGCTAPPVWCHAHNVFEAERGGPTDIDNGVLLCPAHHHTLHSTDFEMKMIDGKPWLLEPIWLDPSQTWRPLGKGRV